MVCVLIWWSMSLYGSLCPYLCPYMVICVLIWWSVSLYGGLCPYMVICVLNGGLCPYMVVCVMKGGGVLPITVGPVCQSDSRQYQQAVCVPGQPGYQCF